MDKKKMIEWIGTYNVGVSSKTMWVALMCPNSIEYESRNYDVPHDTDDFSRCYDLYRFAQLNLNDLRKIVHAFPYWKPIIDEWHNLVSAYLEQKGVLEILDSKRDEVMKLKGFIKKGENCWKKPTMK